MRAALIQYPGDGRCFSLGLMLNYRAQIFADLPAAFRTDNLQSYCWFLRMGVSSLEIPAEVFFRMGIDLPGDD